MLAGTNDLGESGVVDNDVEMVGRLPAKRESDHRAAYGYVSIAKCGESERAIRARVLDISNAQAGHVEKPNDCCDHPIVSEVLSSQVARHARSQGPEHLREQNEIVELVLGLTLGERRVIAVLLSPACIVTCGLKVTAGVGSYPDIAPRRWYGEYANSFQISTRGGPLRALIDIRDACRTPPTNSRLLIRTEMNGSKRLFHTGSPRSAWSCGSLMHMRYPSHHQ
jgi:hypothetical protein